MKKINSLFKLCVLTAIVAFSFSCKSEKGDSAVVEPIERYTVFDAGQDSINVYRIPAVVVANDSSIIVIAEARYISWVDKTRTDVVAKRSTDGGKTWSEMMFLTNDTTGAYMDPTPVVDKTTGKIFLFANFWPFDDHSGKGNIPYLITSDDNGQTWNEPVDISDILLSEGEYSMGFGPGAGIQMTGEKYKGRLIMPTRLASGQDNEKRGYDLALYSDDHGATWQKGEGNGNASEFMIVETRPDTLIYNARVSDIRRSARSFDGGITWTEEETDSMLPSVSGVTRGCQASIFAIGNDIYYCGIEGIPVTEINDERAILALYKSEDAGHTWERVTTLHQDAAAYSCMDVLPDGRMVLIFEGADSPGFTRINLPDVRPYRHPEDGWMRLDLLVFDPENLVEN